MVDREQKIKEFREIVKSNPTFSSKEHIDIAKQKGVSFRKTDMLSERRNVLSLPKPTQKKIEQSTPIKFRKKAPTPKKPKFKPKPKAKPRKITVQKKLPKIPFEKTKFGKIVRDLQKSRNISEKKAIIHARRLLKIDKSDYHKINQKDVQILLTHTP